MIHFKPSLLFSVRKVVQIAPQPTPTARRGGRADHARMMAHAAKRRRSAFGQDASYWKACAPAAIAKAASIRSEGGFARLP